MGATHQELTEELMASDNGLAEGVLELHPKGYGFLRSPARNYAAQNSDAYVGDRLIGKYRLQAGTLLAGKTEPARKGAGPRLATIERIEGADAAAFKPRKFDDLTAIDPHEWLRLETGPEPSDERPRRVG